MEIRLLTSTLERIRKKVMSILPSCSALGGQEGKKKEGERTESDP